MRDPARINRLLSLLSAYWHAHPDLRLAQIVGNLTPQVPVRVDINTRTAYTTEPGDSYYVEDDIIEAALRVALTAPGKKTLTTPNLPGLACHLRSAGQWTWCGRCLSGISDPRRITEDASRVTCKTCRRLMRRRRRIP